MQYQITKSQALLIARLIKNDIQQYISEHQLEYATFLLADLNISPSNLNHD